MAETTPKVTLHWLDRSRSQRVLWLLEELNIPYEIKRYKRQENLLAPPELKEIHALGHAPLITIGDRTIAESAVIVEYLLDHFGGTQHGLVPPRWRDGCQGKFDGETEAWSRYRYFMHYTEGSLVSMMTLALIPMAMKKAPAPFFIRPIISRIAAQLNAVLVTPNFRTHLDFLEAQIASAPEGGPYLCGTQLTGADIMMSFPLLVVRQPLDGPTGPLNKETYPKLYAYTELLESGASYKRAVDKIIELEGEYVVF